MDNLKYAISLIIRGYVLDSYSARNEFRSKYFSGLLNMLKGAGLCLLVLFLCFAPLVAVWLFLWISYDAGFIM